jgi:hypothetical protein
MNQCVHEWDFVGMGTHICLRCGVSRVALLQVDFVVDGVPIVCSACGARSTTDAARSSMTPYRCACGIDGAAYVLATEPASITPDDEALLDAVEPLVAPVKPKRKKP